MANCVPFHRCDAHVMQLFALCCAVGDLKFQLRNFKIGFNRRGAADKAAVLLGKVQPCKLPISDT